MKVLGKVMMGASVGALALTVVGGVKAEATDNTAFTATKTITGLAAGDSVSFDAVKAGKSGATYNLKAKWDLYETKPESVDLSNLKTTKDTYITVNNAGKTEIYKIAKDTLTKFKATCDGSKITIKVGNDEVEDMTKYSWRTDNSSWTSFGSSDLDLTPYTMQGATLYIRYSGLGDSSSNKVATTASTTETVSVDGTDVKVNNIAADSFVAKEIKVKIPKKANAPAISVDYATGTIKKNVKAVGVQADTMANALKKLGDMEKVEADVTIDNSKDGVYLMQTPADTGKNKPASKIAFFSWSASNAPEIDNKLAALTLESKTVDIITGKLVATATDKADVTKATYKLENKTTGDTGVTYEIFKLKDGKADGKAIAKLTPGKTVTWNSAKLSGDIQLGVRIAGDKKAGTLPSPLATNTNFKATYLKTAA